MRIAYTLALASCVASLSDSPSLSLPLRLRPALAGLPARRLLGEQSAQLPLSANAWGQGVFTASIQLGNQPQALDVIADTGSVLLWVVCSGCGAACDAPGPPEFAQGGAFNTTASTSFRPVPCVSTSCVTGICAPVAGSTPQLLGATAQALSTSGGKASAACGYYDAYADGSVSQGTLVEDVLALGSVTLPVLFGCETAAAGNIQQQRLDGILGLGLGDQSVVTQLTAGGAMADAFALCLGDVGAVYTQQAPSASSVVGALVFGQAALDAGAQPATLWSPMIRSVGCWTNYLVSVTGLAVGGADLSQSSPLSRAALQEQYAERCGGTILDSGSSYMYWPHSVLAALTKGIAAALPPSVRVDACPQAALLPNATCYTLPPGSSGAALGGLFPPLVVSLAGGANLTISPAAYLFPLGDPQFPNVYVLGAFDSGGMGGVLGATALANTLVVFDRDNSRVGFVEGGTDCSAFVAQQAATPPPAPHSHPLPDVLPVGARHVVVPLSAVVAMGAGCLLGALIGWAITC